MEIIPAILDLRFVKPLDEKMLTMLGKKYKKWFIFSDSAKLGGVGSAILEFLSQNGMQDIVLTSFEYDDAFITHGNTKLVEESLGILPEQLAQRVNEKLEMKN
jgi:1-deoxy-D-xylulose-5-phosphate synthase